MKILTAGNGVPAGRAATTLGAAGVGRESRLRIAVRPAIAPAAYAWARICGAMRAVHMAALACSS